MIFWSVSIVSVSVISPRNMALVPAIRALVTSPVITTDLDIAVEFAADYLTLAIFAGESESRES